MKSIVSFVAVLALAVSVKPAHASGPISVYAIIDKVTMEPNADKPEHIRIEGVFAIAQNQGAVYGEPRRGFLYFSLGRNAELAKKEWLDLQSVAGTRQVVGFGSAWVSALPRIREGSDNPKDADDYTLNAGVNAGVVKVNADNPRAKELLEFKGR